MSKAKSASLSLVIGVIAGIIVASWFDVQDDTAYYAVVALFGIIGSAVGSALGKKSE